MQISINHIRRSEQPAQPGNVIVDGDSAYLITGLETIRHEQVIVNLATGGMRWMQGGEMFETATPPLMFDVSDAPAIIPGGKVPVGGIVMIDKSPFIKALDYSHGRVIYCNFFNGGGVIIDDPVPLEYHPQAKLTINA